MQVWRQIQPCQPPPSCSPGYPLRSTYGMFRCFRHFRGAALSVAQRVIQDDRRRNLVFYRNQRIGKRAHRHTDLRKVPATLPFPYPARGIWRAVALNRWRLSRRQGVQTFGRQDNRRHGFEYARSPQFITATLRPLGASSRSQWLERKRNRELPSSRGRSGVLFLRLVSSSRRCARRSGKHGARWLGGATKGTQTPFGL